MVCVAKLKFGQEFDVLMCYVERQWLILEGPENISVHDRHARTTSSIEAYNCHLNAIIRAKGNFYQFCQIIIKEVFGKYTDVLSLIESGGASAEPPPKSIINREKSIAKAKELLNAQPPVRITPRQFLRRVAYKSNLSDLSKMSSICAHADDVKIKLEDYIETADPSQHLAPPIGSSLPGSSQALTTQTDDNTRTCVGCYEQANVIFLKCKHLKSCTPCYDRYLAGKQQDHEHTHRNREVKPPLLISCVTCFTMHNPETDVVVGIY